MFRGWTHVVQMSGGGDGDALGGGVGGTDGDGGGQAGGHGGGGDCGGGRPGGNVGGATGAGSDGEGTSDCNEIGKGGGRAFVGSAPTTRMASTRMPIAPAMVSKPTFVRVRCRDAVADAGAAVVCLATTLETSAAES